MNKPKIDINQTQIGPGMTHFQCVKIAPNQVQMPIEFLKNSYKGDIAKFHPKRITEIFLSQKLIHQATGKKVKFEKIKVKDWQRVKGIEKYQFSLSHNPKQVSLLRYETKKYLSCGLDEEVSSRIMDPKSSKLFINEKDNYDRRLSLLSLWVIKEACFKAISPLEPKLKSLKQIEISKQNNFQFQNISGTFERFNSSKNYITFIAKIEKQN